MRSSERRMAIAACVVVLVGCASTEQKMADRSLRKAEVNDAVRIYDGQLVKEGEPHALLSAQPRPIDKVAAFSPYTLRSIDGRVLDRPSYPFIKEAPLARDLAFSELRIPPGKHKSNGF